MYQRNSISQLFSITWLLFAALQLVSSTSIRLNVAFNAQAPWIMDAGPLNASAKDAIGSNVHGFQVDMFEKIVMTAMQINSSLQFTIFYYPNPDQTFGVQNANGHWTGIIGELVDHRADIALGTMMQTASRTRAVTFLPVWRPAPFALLTLVQDEAPNTWLFILPFDSKLWFMIFGFTFIFATFLAITERLSPFGVRYNKELQATERRQFNLPESVASAIASILGQGLSNRSYAWSSRIVGFAMMLFSLLILANYTANLTAFQTVSATTTGINSLADIQLQRLPWGLLVNSSLSEWVTKNPDPGIRRMISYATLFTTYDEGWSLLQAGQIQAMFGGYPNLEYYLTQPPCNAQIVGKMSDDRYWAMGLSPSFPYYQLFQDAQMQAFEAGLIQGLDSKYFLSSECTMAASSSSLSSSVLTFASMAGVFYAVLMVLGISLVSLAAEVIIYHFRDRNGPCKICRRLNICCGYHYEAKQAGAPKGSPQLVWKQLQDDPLNLRWSRQFGKISAGGGASDGDGPTAGSAQRSFQNLFRNRTAERRRPDPEHQSVMIQLTRSITGPLSSAPSDQETKSGGGGVEGNTNYAVETSSRRRDSPTRIQSEAPRNSRIGTDTCTVNPMYFSSPQLQGHAIAERRPSIKRPSGSGTVLVSGSGTCAAFDTSVASSAGLVGASVTN